jgi:response regulator RpfG family c-di-GMP phosphodiesterase
MSLTFLVVDGDPSFRTWCATLLRNLGHVVLEAGNGARATAAIEMCVPDYILIDERLADVDGALWVERNKALCPGARFVFTSSGWRDAASSQRLQQLLGVSLILSKPLSGPDLIERLGSVVGRRLDPRSQYARQAAAA